VRNAVRAPRALTAAGEIATLVSMRMRPRTLSRLVSSSAVALAALSCSPAADFTLAPAPKADEPSRASLPVPEPQKNGRLPGTASPLRYALSLVVDPAKDRFLGNVTIDIEIPKLTQSIVMHGRDLTISNAELMAEGRTVPVKTLSRMSVGGREEPDELVLTLPAAIRPGRGQVRIAYSGSLDQKLAGLYRVKDGDGDYAFTQLEPMEARRMMPCFDEPGFKVPFDLKVTVPKGSVAFGNMNEVDRTTSEDGKSTTFTFGTTPPLPTYLVALAVGPLEVREGTKTPVPIRLIATKGKSRLGDLGIEATAGITTLLGQYFDRPFPYPKLDLVAVPEFGYGAMENPGLITFREDKILLDPASASTSARRGMAQIVAHEVAHHWFGDLVTMAWWDDLWLNEGFATWMEAKIVDAWKPSMEARLEALAWRGGVMEEDAMDSARAVRQPVGSTGEAYEAFDGITYAKGAAVIDMLEGWLGEAPFRDGVRAYIKAHEHGSATSNDLFKALQAASGKDVLPVASSFLDQPGVPLVRADLTCPKGGPPVVKLAQSRYRAKPAAAAAAAAADGGPLWKIPICVGYEGAAAPACKLMEGRSDEIALTAPEAAGKAGAPAKPGGAAVRCPKWIYPNAGEAGYYRFGLPKAQLAGLIGSIKDLDIRARIGLVGHAWALVQSGDLEADALLDLLTSLKGERHRLVLEQVVGVLWRVGHSLVDEESRPAYRAYVSGLLLPIAKEVGWDAKKGESEDRKLLRRMVLRALASLSEDPWLFPEADKKTAAFLRDPRSVDPDIATIALRVSSRRATEKRFDELVGALGRAETPEHRNVVLGALGSFGSPALMRRSLDLMLSDRVRQSDGFQIVWSAASWPDMQPRVLSWVKESFEDLKKKLPSYIVARFAGQVGNLCEAGPRDEAAAFFKEALKSVDGAARPLAQGIEESTLCIDLRAREGGRVKAKLLGGKRR
jgi:aminopeptidase N